MAKSKTPDDASDKTESEDKNDTIDAAEDEVATESEDTFEAVDQEPETDLVEDSSSLDSDASEDLSESDDAQSPSEDSTSYAADAEPTASSTPPPTSESSGSGPGLIPLLIGGVIAGAIGYGAAYFQAQQSELEPVQFDTSALDTQISAQDERLSAVEARLSEVGTTEASEPFDATLLNESQDQLRASIAEIQDRMSTLEASTQEALSKIQELEDRPALVTPDGSQAMAEQLSRFRDELTTLTEEAAAEVEMARDRASEIEQAAAAREARARQEASLAQIQAALESGGPYADALAAFETVPEGLTASANDGVPTQADLQGQFPSAARAALAEAQVIPEEAGAGDRVVAFLRRQTNARSLEPRDGETADAVLSRAEAALGEGDIERALQELEALPEDAAAQFNAWREGATRRRDALAGAATLAGQMESN